MKTMNRCITCIMLLTLSVSTQGQLLDKISKKAQKKVERETERRTEKRINKGINNVLDKAEEGIDETVKGNSEADSKTSPNEKQSKNLNKDQIESQDQSVITWNNYDFIPGTEIIFEDNQENEQNGEFPSKWDLVTGTIENANLNGENVIYIRETGNFPSGIVPMLRNSSGDYLPEEFTLEFDCFFEKDKYASYYLFFYDAKDKTQKRQNTIRVVLHANQISVGSIAEKQYPNAKFGNVSKDKSLWRHISISFNKRALKAYMDDVRLINIPNITENLTGITLSANHATEDKKQFIKNIRLAKGAVPLYDKILTDGKFVTTGIKFDVNKATLKPESIGTLNYVAKMLQDNPNWKFSIEGHTDSDGADTANQALSEKRSQSVRSELINLGIDESRLSCKGWGESKPMAGNDTPEGKAQNRRVEFIKL